MSCPSSYALLRTSKTSTITLHTSRSAVVCTRTTLSVSGTAAVTKCAITCTGIAIPTRPIRALHQARPRRRRTHWHWRRSNPTFSRRAMSLLTPAPYTAVTSRAPTSSVLVTTTIPQWVGKIVTRIFISTRSIRRSHQCARWQGGRGGVRWLCVTLSRGRMALFTSNGTIQGGVTATSILVTACVRQAGEVLAGVFIAA